MVFSLLTRLMISKMSVVKRAALLLLLAAIGTNADPIPTPIPTLIPIPDDCEGLSKMLPTKDLDKIFGDWVLVWSVAEFHNSSDQLTNLSSSQVKIQSHHDESIIEYTESSMFHDKVCTKFSMNMSMPSDPSDADQLTLDIITEKMEMNGVVNETKHSGKVDFYESRDESLVMVYKGSSGSYLLIYRKGKLVDHQHAEQLKSAHVHHQKLAECLKFEHSAKFSYSGSQDSCHEHGHGHGHGHGHEPGHVHVHVHVEAGLKPEPEAVPKEAGAQVEM